MTVQELIEELQQVEDKTKPVMVSHDGTRGGTNVDIVYEAHHAFIIDQ